MLDKYIKIEIVLFYLKQQNRGSLGAGCSSHKSNHKTKEQRVTLRRLAWLSFLKAKQQKADAFESGFSH
jgi:hypothetical protein